MVKMGPLFQHEWDPVLQAPVAVGSMTPMEPGRGVPSNSGGETYQMAKPRREP